MEHSIILKKTDNQFFAFVPTLGILTKSSTADEAYSKAETEIQRIRSAYRDAGSLPLLEIQQNKNLTVKTWSSKFRNWILISLAFYLLGLLGLAVTIGNSLERIGQDLNQKLEFSRPDLARREADLEKFKQQLEYYQPFIDEMKKSFEKKAE